MLLGVLNKRLLISVFASYRKGPFSVSRTMEGGVGGVRLVVHYSQEFSVWSERHTAFKYVLFSSAQR